MALVMILAVESCGDLSPWASVSTPLFNNLTQKNLDMLRTGSPTFQPFTVALATDMQEQPSQFRDVRTEINKRDDVDFTLVLGDMTDRSLRREFEWVGKIIDEFRRPVLTVVGNHDGLLYGKDIYKKMFGPFNYSFIYNDVKFIMWNDNPYEWGYPDLQWLEAEIVSHPRVVIVAHEPPGSLERYPEVNDLWKELYKYPNVLGSVHGHLHHWKYQDIYGKPVLTVERVIGTSWGLLQVNADGIKFQACKGSTCVPYP